MNKNENSICFNSMHWNVSTDFGLSERFFYLRIIIGSRMFSKRRNLLCENVEWKKKQENCFENPPSFCLIRRDTNNPLELITMCYFELFVYNIWGYCEYVFLVYIFDKWNNLWTIFLFLFISTALEEYFVLISNPMKYIELCWFPWDVWKLCFDIILFHFTSVIWE